MQSHYYLFCGHPISQPCSPQDAKIRKEKKKQPESTENPTEMQPNARFFAKA